MKEKRNMITNKLYTILADLLDSILSNTVNKPLNSESRKTAKDYVDKYLHNVLIEDYYDTNDPDYLIISSYIDLIDEDTIRASIAALSKGEHRKAMEVLCQKISIESEPFVKQYLKDLLNNFDTSKNEVEILKARCKELEAEVARLRDMLNQNRSYFTKDNITVESIKSAKVLLRKGNRVEEYSNLETLLEEEEIVLSKPYDEIVRMLKSQSGTKYRYFQQSAKTRIDFYFD